MPENLPNRREVIPLTEPPRCPLCGGKSVPTYVCQECAVEIKFDPTRQKKSLDKCPLCGGEMVLRYFCESCGTDATDVELHCPVCDAVLEADAELCTECGTPLSIEEVEEVVYECPLCGSEIPLGASACPNCGARFEGEGLDSLDDLISMEAEEGRRQRRVRGEYTEENIRTIMKIPGVGRVRAETLCRHGYTTLKSVKKATIDQLASIPHIGKKNAKKIKKTISNLDISELEKRELMDDLIEQEFECPVCGTIVSAFETSCYECGVSFEEEDMDEEEARLKDREKATLSFYDLKLMESPNSPDLWFARGATLSRMGEYDEALKSFERCLEIDPNHRKAWLATGEMLTNMGRYQQAALSYAKAVESAGPDEKSLRMARPGSKMDEHELLDILLEEYSGGHQPCPSCGAAIPDNVTICPECAFDLAPKEISEEVLEASGINALEALETVDEQVNCPLCGAPILLDASICPECGYTIQDKDRMDTGSALDELETLIDFDDGGEPEEKPPRVKEPKKKKERPARTERRGRTNGVVRRRGSSGKKGLTNALTNGLPGGLTNGTGNVNGNGLTNGMAGTGRGRGTKTPHGIINGLTNGSGRLGHGKVNGITNGTGFITSAGFTTVGGFWTRRKYSSITIFVFLILMFSVYAVTVVPQMQSGRAGLIDGNFAEWQDKPQYDVWGMNTGNPDIDIVSASSYLSGSSLYLYFRVSGEVASSSTICTYLAFIDIDNNQSTGYLLEGMGADYLLDIYGKEGRIYGSLSYFAGHDADWNEWQSLSSVRVARGTDAESSMVEASIPVYALSLGYADVSDINIAFASLDSSGNRAISPTVIGCDGAPSLLLTVESTVNSAGIEAISGNSFEMMRFSTRLSPSSSSPVFVSVEGHISAGTLVSDEVRAVSESPTSLSLRADVSTLPEGTSVYAVVHREDVKTDVPVHVSLLHGHASAYVSSAPQDIVVDGAFADWDSVRKSTDPSGDTPSSSADITSYAAVSQGSSIFFYTSTSGNSFEGEPVPFIRENLWEGSEGPTTPSPDLPPVLGLDILHVLIDSDSDPGTGLRVGAQGVDYLVEYRGMYGEIVETRVYSYNGSGWQLISGVLDGAVCGGEFEGSLNISSTGIALENATVIIRSTDWEGNTDWTDAVPADIQLPSSGLKNTSGEVVLLPEFRDFIPFVAVAFLVLIIRRRRMHKL